MINSKVMSMFKDNKPMNTATITVEVSMESGALMSALAEETVRELERISGSTGILSGDLPTQEDVLKAFKTLVHLRVNGTRSQGLSGYVEVVRHFAVPVLLYQLLIPIGRAYDADYSIEFIPVSRIAGEDLLAPQEMMAISDVFRRLENLGFKVVYGIPKDPEGELQFMAMSHVEEKILSYRTADHPVYAFLASFFRQEKLNETTGTMCRILYGYESDFKYYIGRLYSSIDGGD